MKIRNITTEQPEFLDIKKWYEQNLHPDANNYDDQKTFDVYKGEAFPGIFQLTSKGAQRLFRQAEPKSIVDIAVLTSIYRPGPLAANVDKIYLKAKKGEKFEWGHPLFEKVLGETYNCLIFQESVMELAEIIGLFPKDQCDNVRRAIMKRDLSKGEAAMAEAKKMEDQFVDGAVNQGIKEETARQAYQNILFYSSYGFNKSHAIAYAIDSYMCAWLLTHYEKEWLTTYLESMSNNPDDKATAIGEIRKLGYKIVPIDVQYAGKGWTCIEGKKFMPSLLSCKGVGESAVEELLSMRPITDFKDMFWNADGSWRPSKFNSKALDALIKLGAFGSLDVVGSGKLFRSYKHMHDVMIVHKDEIKKVSKRDQYQGYNNFLRLIDEYAQKYDAEELSGEWTKRELADFQAEILGTVDVRMIIDDEIWGTLETKGIKSVDELEQGEKEVVWFVVNGSNLKRTKTGKEFLSAEVMGSKSKIERMNIWGWKSDKNVIKNLTLCIAEVEKNDFGASTTSWKLKTLGE